ncbi:MAG: hypothetical protein QG657_49, partial [Acidobacteriota bacterium]|nr:hypothetical protein [Acidobacteriota bacterium]
LLCILLAHFKMERDSFFRVFGASAVPLKRYGPFALFHGLEFPEGKTRDAFGIGSGKEFQGADEAICAGVVFNVSPQVAAEGIIFPGEPGQFAIHFHVVHEMACQINSFLAYHIVSVLFAVWENSH